MPSDEDDDSEDNVIGIGFFAYLSDDYESDVEIGATLISDESDEDPDSDIEIGSFNSSYRPRKVRFSWKHRVGNFF